MLNSSACPFICLFCIEKAQMTASVELYFWQNQEKEPCEWISFKLLANLQQTAGLDFWVKPQGKPQAFSVIWVLSQNILWPWIRRSPCGVQRNFTPKGTLGWLVCWMIWCNVHSFGEYNNTLKWNKMHRMKVTICNMISRSRVEQFFWGEFLPLDNKSKSSDS